MGGERGDIPEKNRGEHFLLLKYLSYCFFFLLSCLKQTIKDRFFILLFVNLVDS